MVTLIEDFYFEHRVTPGIEANLLGKKASYVVNLSLRNTRGVRLKDVVNHTKVLRDLRENV